MRKLFLMFICFIFYSFNSFAYSEDVRIVNTYMGDVRVFENDLNRTIDYYMGVYSDYLTANFDAKKIKFTGRKYSNMRLYNIYRYVVHRDGSISNIVPVVLENSEFDMYVKNLILSFLPAPFVGDMPDKIDVELEVTQDAEIGFSSGIPGYRRGRDYYRIYISKGVYSD